MNNTDPTSESNPLQAETTITPKKGRWWNWKTWMGLALATVGVWFFRPAKVKATAEATSNLTACVAAAKVLRENLSRQQVFQAEFRPYEEIDLHAKVSGFLETLTVDVGDRVTNGQLLATLEIPELKDDVERAQALERRSEEEINKSDAEHEEAHMASSRMAAVVKTTPNLIAQQDVDLAHAKDRAAEAGLATSRQQMQVAKAERKKLQTMLNYCRVCAPFDGVITRRFLDPGALILNGGSSSTPLVRLSQNARLRLVFPVSVPFVSFIKIGTPLEIRVQSIGKTIAGTVSRFTHKIEMATRTMEVEADIPNRDLTLIPGMYASVNLRLEEHERALVVPVEAVTRQKTTTVFLIDKENKLEERAIKLGLETPDKLEVLDGLTENDLVMIGSRAQVKVGQKVEAKMLDAKLSHD